MVRDVNGMPDTTSVLLAVRVGVRGQHLRNRVGGADLYVESSW
jgi:hypothetical protein